ncbi:DUF2284 domain-containing protein [Dysgonomonas sp. BGC7]|nr:DUF2284 domain-containing protein [Dysgonomonas sp. BGC7]MBD8387445.1 metal-binding protein [Dysgonomonas sp. BGC7]
MYILNNYIVHIDTKNYIADYRNPEKFIGFCKQCNKYNNCWACPPYNFDTEYNITKYNRVYIIGTKIIPSETIRSRCDNAENSKQTGADIITHVRSKLDRQLLDLEIKYPESRAFFAGTCHVCGKEDCTRLTNNPCRYPEKIRHSLESFGFDIGKTTKELLDIELKWSNDGLLPEYFTLVSALFTNEEIDIQL